MAMVAASRKVGETWNRRLLLTLGLTSALYAILDIKSDVLDRPGLDSDAVRLAEVTEISARVWGGLWIAVSLVVTFIAGWIAVTGRRPRRPVDS